MAGGNIFNNNYDSTKTFSVAGALVTWGTNTLFTSNMPMYMQGLAWTYGRQVTPIEPINIAPDGSFKQLNLIGTAAGSIRIDAVMVPEASELLKFLEAAGKGCIDETEQIVLNIQPFHKGCTTTRLEYILKGFTLANVQCTLSQGTLAKQLSGSFSTMEIAE